MRQKQVLKERVLDWISFELSYRWHQKKVLGTLAARRFLELAWVLVLEVVLVLERLQVLALVQALEVQVA